MRRALAALLLVWLAGPALADQVLEADGFQLHYMAMVTTELTPEVASSYGIKRSRSRGVLVLNLQHQDRPLVSLPSTAEGQIRNLIGQPLLRELREVREQDALYWIAEFGFSHLETIRFDFQITPQGHDRPLVLKFHQQFYTPGR